MHLIWQEDFTTNVFSRSKFIKGQIVYQRSAGDGAYFARPYRIEDGAVDVPPGPAARARRAERAARRRAEAGVPVSVRYVMRTRFTLD